jgi:Zn-dependent protease with chaperone function
LTHTFEGYLFPPRSSSRIPVVASVDESGIIHVVGPEHETLLTDTWTALKLSNRVGNTARRITFPDGEVLETSDNDTVDALEAIHRGTTLASLFHRIEKLTLITLAAVLLTAALSASFFIWWLPAASDRLAMALPSSLLSSIGDQSMKVMDRGFLDPSELSDERQAELKAEFARILSQTGALSPPPDLLFRSAPLLGPNAFAMPNGLIILTDEIVALSTHDAQILGVLCHEISHIENRHILRSFLRSTAIAVIIVMITGDMAELTEFAIAIPTFMVEMGYSRDFEREADKRAVELMTQLGENPDHLADMFELMFDTCDGDCDATWLSSHPDIKERIAKIRGPAS